MPHPILGQALVRVERAEEWAESLGASRVFVDLVRPFWELAPIHGGVRPEVALAQSALETNCGRFGGVLDESFRNPCGMKTTAGGGDYDREAHMRFDTWNDGVTAQLDHLALYAGAEGYPRAQTADPRHFPSITGAAKYVEDLGGRWATLPDYGLLVRDRYLVPLLSCAGVRNG